MSKVVIGDCNRGEHDHIKKTKKNNEKRKYISQDSMSTKLM